ncbi:MAG: acylphosphatase [Bacteroidia bacterium]|nr:acylphosphatase [Bacteroidia bacterium]MCX7651606.1 acylphosphatase [Bacteroidia bacterium]MDW8417309.1 acylphosphatase [Bacteroidia bacterium]
MTVVRWRIRIYGKVQGVFFRKYAWRTAQALGLKGFVKNEIDGSVLAEVEGAPAEVEKFFQWAHRGSPAARVEHVEVEKNLPPQGDLSFEIRE